MVTDEEVVRHLMVVLNNADLNTSTATTIRHQLEQRLNADLSDKKALIRSQVGYYLQEQQRHGVFLGGSGGLGLPGTLEEEQDHKYLEGAGLEQQDAELEQFRENIELEIEESSPTEKKRKGGGLNKSCQLSPELEAVIGESILPRTQVVKQLWIYIRQNNLQDPQNRKRIICNDALRTLFETDSTDMFKMNKLLSKHIRSLDSAEGSHPTEPRPKKKKTEKKERKGKNSVFLAPHPISSALQDFFGTGETQLSRAEVVKRIWEYIKENELQIRVIHDRWVRSSIHSWDLSPKNQDKDGRPRYDTRVPANYYQVKNDLRIRIQASVGARSHCCSVIVDDFSHTCSNTLCTS